MFMMGEELVPIGQKWGVLLALLALIAISLQYPLATTFPIGGDLTRYALQSETVQQTPTYLFTGTDYPAAIALLTLGRVLPGSWPSHLTTWLVIAHISAGVALAALCYRLGRWPAAAIGLFFWSLTLTGQTGHIEDATLAQLMSLTPLLLTFIAAAQRKVISTALLLLLTFLFHPFSGFMGLSALMLSAPLIFQGQSLRSARVRLIFLVTVISIAVLLPLLRGFTAITLNIPPNSSEISITDFIKSRFGPFILVAPIGLVMLWRRRSSEPIIAPLIAVFAFVATLLAFNDFLGPTLYAKRFVSYFMLAMSSLSALALPHLMTKAIQPAFLRSAFIVIFVLALITNSWRHNAAVFNFYESSSRYARIHPDELAAIDWMKQHLTSSDVVASTSVNRHSEWIPLLVSVQWQRIQSLEELKTNTAVTHIVFFLHREEVPPYVQTPPLYENKGAAIYERRALTL